MWSTSQCITLFLYFISEASVLIAFLWEFSKISKKKFLLLSLSCGIYTHLFQLISNRIFHNHFLGSSTVFTINTLLCCILLFFLVDLSFGSIMYAIIFSMKYAIFLNAIPFFNISNYSILSTSIRLVLSIILCFTIHRVVIPLLRTYQGSKEWLLLAIAPILESVGLWFVLLSPNMRHMTLPVAFYIGISLIFIATLFADIINAKIIHYIIHTTSLSHQVSQMDHLLSLQKDRFRELVENNEQERKFKHDLRHHMRTIDSLIDHEDYEEVKEYLAQFHEAIPETKLLSGNAVADAIISHYLSLAKKSDITTTCQVSLPASSLISDTDLSIIIGNCLENAIEACKKLPSDQRNLSMISATQGSYITLTFQNSFNGIILRKNNQILSTKRDDHTCGIGLTSVQELAKKQNGTLEITNDNNSFCVSVILQYK